LAYALPTAVAATEQVTTCDLKPRPTIRQIAAAVKSKQTINRLLPLLLPHTHYYYNHFTALWILPGTTRVSQYQKSKTNLDLLEQAIVSGSGSEQIQNIYFHNFL